MRLLLSNLVLVLVLVLVLGGCSSTERSPDHDFEVGRVRYKLTREHGSSRLVLWREEGITWRLVSESPVSE